MSGTPLMARSIITNTESTRIFALAPGNEIATTTLGGATEGNWEIGSEVIASPPMNRMISEITIARAGRCRNFENMNSECLFRVMLQVSENLCGSLEFVFFFRVAIANLANSLEDDLIPLIKALLD